MKKPSEMIIFGLAVIAAIFFARMIYPNISGVPSFASSDSPRAQTADASQAVTAPPALVLPQTSINATAQPDGGENDSASAPAATVFTKINDTALPIFTNESYLVADLTTGGILAGSDTAKRWPTASLTKLMTAALAFDQLSPTTTITISPQMFSADPTERTLVIGGTYSVEDLLHVMLMPSSNVAAQAIADNIGLTQFMDEMNQRAQEWGMTDTYFDDPSGISAANESTARDLMILAQHIYTQYPGILALTDTPATTITELNSGKKLPVRSINIFAGEPNFVGGKTGNTDQAGGNLLSIFNYDGHPVVVIVLGAPALPFQDTSALYAWFRTDYK